VDGHFSSCGIGRCSRPIKWSAHGATRADTPEREAKRRQFIQELQVALPIHLFTATLGETYVAVC